MARFSKANFTAILDNHMDALSLVAAGKGLKYNNRYHQGYGFDTDNGTSQVWGKGRDLNYLYGQWNFIQRLMSDDWYVVTRYGNRYSKAEICAYLEDRLDDLSSPDNSISKTDSDEDYRRGGEVAMIQGLLAYLKKGTDLDPNGGVALTEDEQARMAKVVRASMGRDSYL